MVVISMTGSAIAERQQPLSRWMSSISSEEFGQLVSSVLRSPILDSNESLFSPALYNDLDRLRNFIQAGQQNAVDKTGYTPLHYASRNGHLEACELLLDAGAHVNAATAAGGATSLMRAALTSKTHFYDQTDCSVTHVFISSLYRQIESEL